MKFNPTPLADVFLIELAPYEDERGSFMRTFCKKAFADQGIDFDAVQTNISVNKRKNTLRGLHYQIPPHEEAKLVQCIQGRCYDVVVDLRIDSATFGEWFAAELSPQKHNIMYVPPGCAHGFLTLEDNTTLYYQMSNFYDPEAGYGVHWQSPMLAIPWPVRHAVISEQDQLWPDFDSSNFVLDEPQENF